MLNLNINTSPFDSGKARRKEDIRDVSSIHKFDTVSAMHIPILASNILYDITDLPQDFAPLLPIFKQYKKNLEADEHLSEADVYSRLDDFMQAFHFNVSIISGYAFEATTSLTITPESEPYYNLVEANNRNRFYDLRIAGADDDAEQGSAYVKDNSMTARLYILAGGSDVGYGRIVIGVGTTHPRVRVYKDATITAPAFLKYLNPIETAVVAYETFAKDIIELSPIHWLRYDGLTELANKEVNRTIITDTAIGGYEAQLCEGFNVVGTEEDFERLDEVLKHLQIYCGEEQRIVVDSSKVLEQSSSTMIEHLTASANKVDTTKDYGAFMYFAWLAFSDFFLGVWGGFRHTADWLKLVGSENVVDILRRLVTYAVVTTGTDVFLVTSAGFLRITQGTIKAPEVVEWLNLTTMESLCGLTESKLTEAEHRDLLARFMNPLMLEELKPEYFQKKDSHFVKTVQILSYFYRKSCGLLGDRYNLLWMCRERLCDYMYESEGYYINLCSVMATDISDADFKATMFDTSAPSIEKDDFTKSAEVQTMWRIINILHCLFNSGYDVKICETCVGQKTAPPVLLSLDGVVSSKTYHKLPKTLSESDSLVLE